MLGNLCFEFEFDVQNDIWEYIRKSKIFEYYLDAPYNKQIIEKPRGYAGDSEMMSIIYNIEFEGNSLLGKLIHKIATKCDACVTNMLIKSLFIYFIQFKAYNMPRIRKGRKGKFYL